jgi:superfamily II RNA helicase
MTSEIIQSVAYANYDDFQHINFIFFKKNHFTILRII